MTCNVLNKATATRQHAVTRLLLILIRHPRPEKRQLYRAELNLPADTTAILTGSSSYPARAAHTKFRGFIESPVSPSNSANNTELDKPRGRLGRKNSREFFRRWWRSCELSTFLGRDSMNFSLATVVGGICRSFETHEATFMTAHRRRRPPRLPHVRKSTTSRCVGRRICGSHAEKIPPEWTKSIIIWQIKFCTYIPDNRLREITCPEPDGLHRTSWTTDTTAYSRHVLYSARFLHAEILHLGKCKITRNANM